MIGFDEIEIKNMCEGKIFSLKNILNIHKTFFFMFGEN
jgi:hypothetical protein